MLACQHRYGVFLVLVIRRHVIRPKSAVILLVLTLQFGQRRHVAVECDSDVRAKARRRLKHCNDVVPVTHVLADQRRALGGEIAELDAALAVDGDGVFVGRVLRLGNQLDRIARRTEGDLESARRALALVGEVGADDGERDGRRRQ